MAKRALKQKFQVWARPLYPSQTPRLPTAREGKNAEEFSPKMILVCPLCPPSQDGLALFNKKARKGLEMLQKEGMLGTTPGEVATFLAKTQGLDKVIIGDYLGEREEFSLKVGATAPWASWVDMLGGHDTIWVLASVWLGHGIYLAQATWHPCVLLGSPISLDGCEGGLCVTLCVTRSDPFSQVMHCYVDAMDFTELDFDDAIRSFLSGFRLDISVAGTNSISMDGQSLSLPPFP